jgi:hypothetical protein
LRGTYRKIVDVIYHERGQNEMDDQKNVNEVEVFGKKMPLEKMLEAISAAGMRTREGLILAEAEIEALRNGGKFLAGEIDGIARWKEGELETSLKTIKTMASMLLRLDHRIDMMNQMLNAVIPEYGEPVPGGEKLGRAEEIEELHRLFEKSN